MKIETYFQKNKEPFSPLLVVGELSSEKIEKNFGISPADKFVLDISPIKIEEIRKLILWTNFKPLNGEYKLVILKACDSLTLDSANAILKTLEEPPKYLIFILQTLEEQKILPTILSRCQKIRVPLREYGEVPENYLSPDKLIKMSVKEKFHWVGNVFEDPNLDRILSFWQEYYREKLLRDENKIEMLREISRAKDLLRTNISVKLLLENLVLILT